MAELNHNTRKKNAKKVKKVWQNLANAREASFNARKLLDNDVDNSDRQKAYAKHQREFNKMFEKFMKTAIELGIDEEFFTMQKVQQITAYVNEHKYTVGHNYNEGDNSNRENGFVHNPYHTLKGKFFQNAIKPMIRKAIYGAHAYWLAKYDKDAFVYDDARLKAVDEFTKNFIDVRMAESDNAAYKIEFMHHLRDLACGMVKEDPFYTQLFWVFINEFVKEFSDGFEMTEAEIYNWEVHQHVKTNTDD